MTTFIPDLHGLKTAQEEVLQASNKTTPGPAEYLRYIDLMKHLEGSRARLPPIYQTKVLNPFMAELRALGDPGFQDILARDPERTSTAALLQDIAQAVTQAGERYEHLATDAFEEVVTDLYDGFLSAEDRVHVLPPDLGVLPPLVKWGHPDYGPYTWPVDATESFNVNASIVNLPPAFANGGLLAWATIGHETGGHDILHADTGLLGQLSQAVTHTPISPFLADYWASRIDETASDVLGILNMGPAAAMGVLGYLRAVRGGKLAIVGPEDDEHPADILRGWLAASTVELLAFDRAKGWSTSIHAQVDGDAQGRRIAIGGRYQDSAILKKSAELVAKAICSTPMAALEQHTLLSIQNWRTSDETLASQVQAVLKANALLPKKPIYAAHVVAGAVTGALAGGDPVTLHKRMVVALKALHDKNPAWGPIHVKHPGNMVRHFSRAPVDEAKELAEAT